MSPYKCIKGVIKPKADVDGADFSTFVPTALLTCKQQLIEECQKQDISIYIDDTSEQSVIFRCVASEAELERRLNAKNAITLSKAANEISKAANEISKGANKIAFAAFIAATISLVVATIALVKTFL